MGAAGTLAVCSFYATKLVTTGEGGAVAGADALVARVRDLRDYDERDDLVPRLNAKLTDLAAALGRSQLARFDAFVGRRRAIAARYRARLAGAPCALPPEVGARHVFHRFVVEVDRAPDAVQAALAARGVMTDSRGSWLRLGPAPYLGDEQLEAAVALLGESLRSLPRSS